MSAILLVSKCLLFGASLILVAALVRIRGLLQRLPNGRARRSWRAMASLIALFLLGFLVYAIVYWDRPTTFASLLPPAIFLVGASFVWLSANLSLQTAIDLLRLDRLQREATTDPLTGVSNRRHLDRCLREETNQALRYDLPLSILLFDIDHFKQINDSLGHGVGDQILIEFADLIAGSLRESDTIARYGGEEFVVIAPRTTPADAFEMAERLRLRVAENGFIVWEAPEGAGSTDALPSRHAADIAARDSAGSIVEIKPPAAAHRRVDVTTSIGVATLDSKTATVEALLRAADQHLYAAKQGGRNRVVAAETDHKPASDQAPASVTQARGQFQAPVA